MYPVTCAPEKVGAPGISFEVKLLAIGISWHLVALARGHKATGSGTMGFLLPVLQCQQDLKRLNVLRVLDDKPS